MHVNSTYFLRALQQTDAQVLSSQEILNKGQLGAFWGAQVVLDEDTTEAIKERAAIFQYDGPMSREDAERNALARISPNSLSGIDELKNFLSQGILLIGLWPESGASIEPWSNRSNFTQSINELQNLWEGQGNNRGRAKGKSIRRFAFVPGEAGLICLDLDRGHKDKADGVASLETYFNSKGLLLPRSLANINGGSFPAYTRTPSGGFHLYFRYTGTKKYSHQTIGPGLEVVHFNHTLTAPGSEKETGRYVFFGSLANAPLFPPVLEQNLTPMLEYRAKAPPKPKFSSPVEQGPPGLERIAQWAIDDDHPAGRNETCFSIARRAARPNYNYTREEVKTFLASYAPIEGLPLREINTTVDSAFKYKEHS